jgi:hypothetical protein
VKDIAKLRLGWWLGRFAMHADATNRNATNDARPYAGHARALLDRAPTTKPRKTDSRYCFMSRQQSVKRRYDGGT